ncbi:MAG: hypothetical protein HUU60_03225 [Armatimonadetes bacterium]|nr:hypothetical protein [Armatimonadota bacterium]
MVIMLGALLALVSGGFAKNLAYQSQKAIDTLATTVAQRASQLFSANSTSLNADISVPKPVEPGKTVLTSTKPERKAPKKSIAPIPSKATAPAIQGEEDALFAMEDGLETDSPLPTEIKMVSLSEESSCEFSIQTHRAENRYRFFVRLPSVPVMVLTQP